MSRRSRLQGGVFPALPISIAFMLVKAIQYSNITGAMLDWATYYQSMWSIIHGNLLGGNYVPGLPYLAEHFSPILIALSPLALLPGWLAYFLMNTIELTLVLYFTLLITSRLRTSSLAAAVLLTPGMLANPVPETYILSVLAPLGVGLIWLGDRRGWVAVALSLLSIEFVPSYIIVVMVLVRLLYMRLTTGEAPLLKPQLILITVAVTAVVAQYAALSVLRGIVDYPYRNPILNIVGIEALSITWRKFMLWVLGSVMDNPLVYLQPLSLVAWVPLTLPLMLVSPLYLTPAVYYWVPFVAAGVVTLFFMPNASFVRYFKLRLSRVPGGFTVTLQRAVGVVKLNELTYVGFLTTAVVVVTMSSGLTFIHTVVIPPPTPQGVVTLYWLSHLRVNASSIHGVIVMNPLACGYGPTWLTLHCTPPYGPIEFINVSTPVFAIMLKSWVTLPSPYLEVNPRVINCTLASRLILGNATYGELYACTRGNLLKPGDLVVSSVNSVINWYNNLIAVYSYVAVALASAAWGIAVVLGKLFKHP